MAMEFKKALAVLSGVAGVDDAEHLLQWLQDHPGARVDLSHCTHIHPANLQVLMVTCTPVAAWPTDVALTRWLQSALL